MKIDLDRQYVIGTAGHIDHGKTALVKALTGVDTDRLPEEKKRGITIDIGFAHLTPNITIIDVPGHERLIKNMVAGVSTIDLVLFIIAADDGIMPQTREHLDIIRLLQIEHGIFVITKIDLVEADWLELVKEDVRALLRDTRFKDAPILQTSVETGDGIEETRKTLFTVLGAIPTRYDVEIFREPVDRVFTMKGFGTVITGTVLSGQLKTGESVEIQPTGTICRVRGLQTHDENVEQVSGGFRAAVNLAGIEVGQIQRGEVLTAPGFYRPVSLFNARLTLLESAPVKLKNNQRVRLHVHTREAFARVVIPERKELNPGETAFVQMRLEEPVHAAFRDRFIIRRYSPQHTLGGGIVLQTNPLRFRKKHLAEFKTALEKLERGNAEEKILAGFRVVQPVPLTETELKVGTNLRWKELRENIRKLMEKRLLFRKTIAGKNFYYSLPQIETVLERLREFLNHIHRSEPGKPGLSEAEIISGLEKRFLQDLIRLALDYGRQKAVLTEEEGAIRLAEFKPLKSKAQTALLEQLRTAYHGKVFAPPTYKEALQKFGVSPRQLKEAVNSLPQSDRPVYLTDNILYHPAALQAARQKLAVFFRSKPEITVSEFRELLGVTRKHAIPLLEYFDQHGVTRRDGDVRKPGPELTSG